MSASARIIISLIFGGLFYAAWLALFLTAVTLDFDLAEVLIWVFAPATAAMGFTLGIMIAERRGGSSRNRFSKIVIWPLTGCFLGAAAMFWLGAMSIAFGMLLGGTAAMIAREVMGPSP